MTTRVMYDSTTADDCPPGADLYAGYISGTWLTYDRLLQLYGSSKMVSVSVTAAQAAEVLDIESGDATPDQAPSWWQRSRQADVERPCCYCNQSTEPAVDEALHAAGVPTTQACFWIATLDGTIVQGVTPHGYPIVACQNQGQAQTGGHYDSSVVFDDSWPTGDVPMDQSQLAAWMADIEARVAGMAKTLSSGQPLQGATMYYGVTDPAGAAAQVAGMKQDPQATGNTMFSTISGVDKNATYPLPVPAGPVGPVGPPGPQGPPGTPGAVADHHHDLTVTAAGSTSGRKP
jgi:hypothetical protein